MKTEQLGVDEFDLIAFFGSNHVSRQFGTEWYDSDSCYEVTTDSGLSLTFAIHPIHRDVRLRLVHHGVEIFDWQATDLDDICCIGKNDQSKLKLIEGPYDFVIVQVDPEIRITRETRGEHTDVV